MSKIQGKPFIDSVISSVEDKSELLALLNGKTKVPTFYSLINETYAIDDTDEVQFVTLETQNKSYTGYLIVNDDYCVVIAFTDDVQALDVLKIIDDNNYVLINESLTINELRTVLGLELVEAGELVHVQADDVDSGTATLGQVLTADGEGGASWENASAGMENPMTTAGDIIYGGADGVPTRLAKGTAGQVLAMNSGATAPEWKDASSTTFVDWS